jgi:hypothetical protein
MRTTAISQKIKTSGDRSAYSFSIPNPSKEKQSGDLPKQLIPRWSRRIRPGQKSITAG